jgi:hypothetical protein
MQPSSTSQLCSTRSMKVLKYLHRTVPKTISRSSLHALEKLPPGMLSSLHTASDWDRMINDEKLKHWLIDNPIPSPKATVSSPLFNGTLVFAQITFRRANQPDFSVSLADMQMAVSYATVAVVPIQRCASQYGPNSVSVSPTVIPLTVTLTSNAFTEGDLEGWVEQVAQTARDNHVTNPCIMILHDRSRPTTPTYTGHRDAYHSTAGNGTPYCYCLVFGQNLSVADNNHTINNRPNEKVYAHILSHEIAEMVVDPAADLSNPEVCDACAGNCTNDQFDLFDQNGVFMGGTADTASATGFGFFINSIVRADVPLTPKQCLVDMGLNQSACIYAPPLGWSGPGTLTTVNNPKSVAGHFSSGDQRHLVVVGTSTGKVHEIFWRPAQIGIEGEDDLPVAFGTGAIVSVATMYALDQQRHVVVVGTTSGTVHEIFWKPETVGIEGHDDLPVNFAANSIVAVGALYDTNQQRHLVLVGTSAGRVHEIFWKADTVGVEGHDDLPVMFTPGSIVAVAAIYDSDQQRYIVVVGTTAGKLHEIFWKPDTVGIEGHDDLPVDFGSRSIVAVSGFYDSNRKRYVVAVGTSDGTVHQVYWKALTVGIEAHSTVAKFNPNSIVSVAAFYSVSDNVNHIVVALSNGQLREWWVTPDI